MRWNIVACGVALWTVLCTLGLSAAHANTDFGLTIERLLKAFAATLFGVQAPLQESALGPCTDPDSTKALEVAKGLEVSVVSNVTAPLADMIALWPNDAQPTHLFVCVENSFAGDSNSDIVSVQRVDLTGDPDSNVETIVKGLSACDPIRRTPWGTLIVAEEAGATGGFYEILDPLAISGASPVIILSRAAGTTSDPQHVVKRQAVGSLSFEGIVIRREDGTMYFGDELRPSQGKPGGAIYKFVPETPYNPSAGVITDPTQSPFVSGTIYGLRLGTRSNNTDYGQGSEIGRGIWIPIDPTQQPTDADGNIILRDGQVALGLTGYYRPEDMEQDPLAEAEGLTRVCWTNTGNLTNGGGSAVEGAANYGEILCLEDEPDDDAASGAMPLVTRFVNGNPQFGMPDNIAFQLYTGRLVVLEDGEVEVLNTDGSLRELRGNDLWMCLPDGADDDALNDGCIRITSLKDTDAEPTGFIFDASSERAFMNLQHRATGKGALVQISGFQVRP